MVHNVSGTCDVQRVSSFLGKHKDLKLHLVRTMFAVDDLDDQGFISGHHMARCHGMFGRSLAAERFGLSPSFFFLALRLIRAAIIALGNFFFAIIFSQLAVTNSRKCPPTKLSNSRSANMVRTRAIWSLVQKAALHGKRHRHGFV